MKHCQNIPIVNWSNGQSFIEIGQKLWISFSKQAIWKTISFLAIFMFQLLRISKFLKTSLILYLAPLSIWKVSKISLSSKINHIFNCYLLKSRYIKTNRVMYLRNVLFHYFSQSCWTFSYIDSINSCRICHRVWIALAHPV